MPDIAKFCKNCRWHLPATVHVALARCGKTRLFEGVSPVTGEGYFMGCDMARSTHLDWQEKPMCGPDGKWFEEKT